MRVSTESGGGARRCPTCRKVVRIELSTPALDATCPACGALIVARRVRKEPAQDQLRHPVDARVSKFAGERTLTGVYRYRLQRRRCVSANRFVPVIEFWIEVHLKGSLKESRVWHLWMASNDERRLTRRQTMKYSEARGLLTRGELVQHVVRSPELLLYGSTPDFGQLVTLYHHPSAPVKIAALLLIVSQFPRRSAGFLHRARDDRHYALKSFARVWSCDDMSVARLQNELAVTVACSR